MSTKILEIKEMVVSMKGSIVNIKEQIKSEIKSKKYEYSYVHQDR